MFNVKVFFKRLGELKEKGGLGYKIVLGGIDNYFVFVDLKLYGVDGVRVEWILELVGVVFNKNIVLGDKSVLMFGGLRMGILVMMMRGF